jgi:hypothetical protein
MRGRRVTAAVLALGLVFLAACGDDDDSDAAGSSGESGTTAPEDLRVSDAEAAAGLQQIDDLVDQVAERVGDGDDDGAVEANDQINPVWVSVEGTIKENDQDAYLTFEDQFAVLTRAMDEADSVGAQTAAETVSDTAGSYLADHPGS